MKQQENTVDNRLSERASREHRKKGLGTGFLKLKASQVEVMKEGGLGDLQGL